LDICLRALIACQDGYGKFKIVSSITKQMKEVNSGVGFSKKEIVELSG